MSTKTVQITDLLRTYWPIALAVPLAVATLPVHGWPAWALSAVCWGLQALQWRQIRRERRERMVREVMES